MSPKLMSRKPTFGKPVSWKLVAAVAVVLGGIAYLLVTGTSGAMTYYVTVDEMLERREFLAGRPVRVMGSLVGESIDYDPAVPRLRFTLAGAGARRLEVDYLGIQPDQMHDGWEVIAEGRLKAGGSFEAGKVMVKCPSRYEGALPLDAPPPESFPSGPPEAPVLPIPPGAGL
ncbi:MAG: cytochrome c maturation protein CcmE [Firmicutes bacterium]|nr:cytochrome c maturation protein CcmE [Bacillota bacterium]